SRTLAARWSKALACDADQEAVPAQPARPSNALFALQSDRALLSRSSLVRTLAHPPLATAHVFAGLGLEPRVLADLERPYLPLELAVAREALGRKRAVCKRGLHRTAGLVLVRAVREPAFARELGDLGEGAVEHLFVRPELELTHPGRVDQKRAGWKGNELPMGRRV